MATPWSKTYRDEGHTFRKFRGRRRQLAECRVANLRRGPFAQVPDLRAPHAAVPGKLSGRRGYPGLAPGGTRTGEAARGHELAGVRVPARHRRQPVSVTDGPGLSGAVRGRLQPQRGRGLRRNQRRGAVHRRYRRGRGLHVRAARPRYRQAHRDRRRRSGGDDCRVPAPPARASLHDLRRPRGPRRHDALRHSRLPDAAAVPGPRNRSHPRPRRHRDALFDAGRPRCEHRGDRGGARRGPVDDRMPERASPSRARRGCAELREWGEVPRSVQHRQVAGCGGPGGMRRRRRHVDRRGLGCPAARSDQPHQPEGSARNGGAAASSPTMSRWRRRARGRRSP